MNGWNRLLIGNDRQIEKRNIVWNTAGSAFYALTSILLGAAVTRVLGADQGGIFFFAFSTFGQQMFIVAYFGMRPIQITDTANRFSFGDYRRFRLLTCGAAILISLFYAFLFVPRALNRTVILLMVIYKVTDGLADCWDSEFQRNGRLYLTGKSNAGRAFLSVAVFMAALLLKKDLVFSCAAAVLGEIAGFVLFCRLPAGELGGIDRTVHADTWKVLFRKSGWLFLSAFLDLYIFAASKYAVNTFLTDADNSYYSTIFIPTSVINLMANFVIRPVLTKLSDFWETGERKKFRSVILRISAVVAGLTAAGMAAAFLCGIPVLSMLLGKTAGASLQPYRGALVIVILGGGFYALLNLLYYVLVILKEERAIFLIYAVCCAAAWYLSGEMVKRAGINGAALSYLVLMVLVTVLFAAAAVFGFRRKS